MQELRIDIDRTGIVLRETREPSSNALLAVQDGLRMSAVFINKDHAEQIREWLTRFLFDPTKEKGGGFLEVGTNAHGEVVVNLPRDMTGHIVFSPEEADQLGNLLIYKAIVASGSAHLPPAESSSKRLGELCEAVASYIDLDDVTTELTGQERRIFELKLAEERRKARTRLVDSVLKLKGDEPVYATRSE